MGDCCGDHRGWEDMEPQPSVADDTPRCDHICLLDDGHVERGEPHFYGYENPPPRLRPECFCPDDPTDLEGPRCPVHEVEQLKAELAEARRSGQIAMSALIEACYDGWSDGTGALNSYLRAARERFAAPPTASTRRHDAISKCWCGDFHTPAEVDALAASTRLAGED